MKQNASEIINILPLSNSSVSQRIDEMAEDVEKQLISHLQVKQFALQLDESTLRDNEAILLAYVRFNSDEGHKEEMLFARSLVTDTKGETIFNEAVTYFQQNNIPLKNIIACATDGAPSMTSRYNGFIAHIKKAVPEVFCIHCVIHRQHLVAKKLSAHLHDALTVVMQVVNLMKLNSLRDRPFHELCKQNGEEFERLVLHTELQGKNSDLISSRSAIVAFLRKQQLYKNNVRRRAFEQFPCLASVGSDMQIRFSDLPMMVIKTWVSNPFEVNTADIDISLQEPLIKLQSDEIMRAKFKDGKYNVWKTNDVAIKYPLLWDSAHISVIAFPTSYLVESGFSCVSQLLSKARNRLDIVKRGDLRLSLISMEPDIKKLAEQHQPQGSH
ncbi:SCAN domain-containing protein 3-like [Palaemon carinicauda]|uniref:SCAN domain-containing protein 3-like n=1 Tax=Palaemon carinicauda TaxID=392227 RepID=UPI0035B692F7